MQKFSIWAGSFSLPYWRLFNFASAIILPIVLAVVLKLLLQPLVRLLEQIHLPPAFGALLTILLVVGCLIGFGAALSGPAASWAANICTDAWMRSRLT